MDCTDVSSHLDRAHIAVRALVFLGNTSIGAGCRSSYRISSLHLLSVAPSSSIGSSLGSSLVHSDPPLRLSVAWLLYGIARGLLETSVFPSRQVQSGIRVHHD